MTTPRPYNSLVDAPAHRFLAVAEQAASRSEAEDHLRNFIHIYGGDADALLAQSAPDASLTFMNAQGKTTVLLTDLLRDIQETGILTEGDRQLWRDTHPHGSIEAATDADQFPEMILQTGGGRRTSPLEAPGYLSTDALSPLLDDILHYRRLAVEFSTFDTESKYQDCFRAYRSYLVACISAVDSFLNEWSWSAVDDPARSLAPDERAILSKRRVPLHVKLTDWPPIIAGSCVLCSSPEWKLLDKIREGRNAIVHVNEPEFNFSLRKAAEALNWCRGGVGGLLMLLENTAHRWPAPKVWAVRFAPRISFCAKPRAQTPAQ